MFLLTKYQYYIYIFSPFPPLHFGAAFSVLAFSTTAHWCRVFRSRHFHPCRLVPRFPFSRFPPLHFRRCRVFRSRLFSRPVVSLKALTRTRSNFTRCTSKTKCWVVYSCTARKRSCLHDIAMWRRRAVRAAASSYRRRLPTRCRVVLAAAPVIVDWLRPPAAARPPTSSSPAIGRAQR